MKLKDLPNYLKSHREKYRLRQKDMAYLLDMELMTYQYYERGLMRMWNSTIDRMLEGEAFDDDYVREFSKKSRDEMNQLIARWELEKKGPVEHAGFQFSGADMKEFARMLVEKRRLYRISAKQAAEISKLPVTTYKNYESGNIEVMTDAARQIRDLFLTADLEGDYRVAQFVRNEDHLIRNLPNFYKDLNSLCGEDGSLKEVDRNHPKLQELRMSVGGKRIMRSGG